LSPVVARVRVSCPALCVGLCVGQKKWVDGHLVVRKVNVMDLLEEIRKARAGKESRVRLHPVPPEDLEIERLRKDKGYEIAFGTGYESRKELIESLVPRGPLKHTD
jgi:hypothetical protein